MHTKLFYFYTYNVSKLEIPKIYLRFLFVNSNPSIILLKFNIIIYIDVINTTLLISILIILYF